MAAASRLTRVVCALATVGWLSTPPSVSAQNLQYLSGQNVVPAFEGWERNADGSFTFYFGYLNRNYREELNIPLGPDNRIEPDHLAQTQPAYFYPRRHRFLFSLQVPADWGDRDVLWTLTSAGKTETAYGSLLPVWEVNDQVKSENRAGGGYADGNQPPTIALIGAAERTAKVGDDDIPEPRPVRGAKDPRIDVDASGRPLFGAGRFGRRTALGLRAAWLHWRGPGTVIFDPWHMAGIDDRMPGWAPPELPADGRVTTTAIFSAPGTYVVRTMADDGYLSAPLDITVSVTEAP
jgi:hypothetical protein